MTSTALSPRNSPIYALSPSSITACALFLRYTTTYAFSPDIRLLMPSLRITRHLVPSLRLTQQLVTSLRDTRQLMPSLRDTRQRMPSLRVTRQ